MPSWPVLVLIVCVIVIFYLIFEGTVNNRYREYERQKDAFGKSVDNATLYLADKVQPLPVIQPFVPVQDMQKEQSFKDMLIVPLEKLLMKTGVVATVGLSREQLLVVVQSNLDGFFRDHYGCKKSPVHPYNENGLLTSDLALYTPTKSEAIKILHPDMTHHYASFSDTSKYIIDTSRYIAPSMVYHDHLKMSKEWYLLGMGGIYLHAVMPCTKTIDLVVTLSRQSLLDLMHVNKLIQSPESEGHTEASKQIRYSEYTQMLSVRFRNDYTITGSYWQEHTSLITAKNFGYSEELNSHFVVIPTHRVAHELEPDVVNVWPVESLTQEVVDEFSEFAKAHRATVDDHKQEFQYYRSGGFFHMSLTYENATGHSNTIIFSDRKSNFNIPSLFDEQRGQDQLGGELLKSFGLPTDAGRRVIALDANRSITWIYNGLLDA